MVKVAAEEKIQAVKKYLEGNEGLKTVAESVGVTKAMLQTWIRQYQHHGEDSFRKGYAAYSAEYKPVKHPYCGHCTSYSTSFIEFH